jgi:hypothetical protein
VNLTDAARALGLDDALIGELAEILDWGDAGSGTDSDVTLLRIVAYALQLGMPRDALMQMVPCPFDLLCWYVDRRRRYGGSVAVSASTVRADV